jgi:phage terminase Nu1 subunit (DNA packaging protein)
MMEKPALCIASARGKISRMTELKNIDVATIRVSRSQLAQVLGTSGSRISQMTTEGVLPKPEGHEYNLAGCVKAFVAFKSRNAEAPRERANFLAARARWMQSRASAAELAQEARRGKFLATDMVNRVLCDLFLAVRTRLLVTPSRFAARWSSIKTQAEAETLLHNLTCEALEGTATMDVEPLIARIVNVEGRCEHAEDIED